jgi:protein TonB
MRILGSVVAGVVVALLLFLLMEALVGGREGFERDTSGGQIVDFIRVPEEELVQRKEREPPKKPPPPDKPPPPPKVQVSSPQAPQRQMLDIETPDISTGMTGGPIVAAGWQAAGAAAEGDIIPIVRIEPNYPREALIKGIEGWVRVKFTILPDGSVANPSVIDSEPPRLFNRDALRAILRWKFKPRIVDGQPVARDAEQTIEFKMNQEAAGS